MSGEETQQTLESKIQKELEQVVASFDVNIAAAKNLIKIFKEEDNNDYFSNTFESLVSILENINIRKGNGHPLKGLYSICTSKYFDNYNCKINIKYGNNSNSEYYNFEHLFHSDIAEVQNIIRDLCDDYCGKHSLLVEFCDDPIKGQEEVARISTRNNNQEEEEETWKNETQVEDWNNIQFNCLRCRIDYKKKERVNIIWSDYINKIKDTVNKIDECLELKEVINKAGASVALKELFKRTIKGRKINAVNFYMIFLQEWLNEKLIDINKNKKEQAETQAINAMKEQGESFIKKLIDVSNYTLKIDDMTIDEGTMTKKERQTKAIIQLKNLDCWNNFFELIKPDADNDNADNNNNDDNDTTDNTNVLKVNLNDPYLDNIKAAIETLKTQLINRSANSADPSNTTEENNEHKQEEYEKIECGRTEDPSVQRDTEYTIKINDTCYCLGCHKWHQIHKDTTATWGYSSIFCDYYEMYTSCCVRCGSNKNHTAIENLDPKSNEPFKAAKLNCEELNVENEDLETLVNKVMLKITKDNFNIKDLTRLKEILPNYDSPDVTNKNRNVVTVAKDVNTSSNQIGDDINQEPAAKIDTVQTIDSKEKFSKDDIKRDLSDEDIKNIKNLEEISKNPYDRIFTKLSDPQNSNEFDKKYFDTSTVVLDGNGEQDMFEKLHMSIFYDTDEEQEVLFTNNGLFNLCMSDIYYQLMKDNTVWLHSCYKMDERDQFKVKKFKVQFKNDVIQANQISQISLNLHQLIPYISNNDTILYDRVLSLRYNKQVHRRIEFIEENSSDEKKTGEKRKGKGGRTVGSKKQKQETKK
jgi:hypothetical protein